MKLLDQLQYIREGELVEIRKFGISQFLTIRLRAGKTSRCYIETDHVLVINVCSE